MAGFKDNEPRDRRGRWVHDPTASPQETALLDLAVIRRKAYDNVKARQHELNKGEDFSAPNRRERAGMAILRVNDKVKRASDKFYSTRFGKVMNWLYKDRFTGLVPPGSKRDLVVRTAASIAGLGLTGGLSALSPTWAAGKAMRFGDWGYKNKMFRDARKAQAEARKGQGVT